MSEITHAIAACVPLIVGAAIGIAAVLLPRLVERWLDHRAGIPWERRKG
jgi:cyanate permease